MRIAAPTKVSEMKVTSTTETTIEALRRRPLAASREHESEPHLVGPTFCSPVAFGFSPGGAQAEFLGQRELFGNVVLGDRQQRPGHAACSASAAGALGLGAADAARQPGTGARSTGGRGDHGAASMRGTAGADVSGYEAAAPGRRRGRERERRGRLARPVGRAPRRPGWPGAACAARVGGRDGERSASRAWLA